MITLRTGSFTAAVGADGEGIVSTDLTPDAAGWVSGDRRVNAVGSPTFMATHPTRSLLYVASETPNGELHTFRLMPDGSLAAQSTTNTAPSPAHIVIGEAGGSLFAVTSHYYGGCFALHRVLADGSLEEPCDVVDRNRPDAGGAGRISHAHASRFVRDGRLVSADLGHDAVLSYRVDPQAGRLEQLAELRVPTGAGPRHLALHRDGRVFVSGELDASVMTIRVDDSGGRLDLVDKRPSVGTQVADAGTLPIPAEIALSHDDRFLHVANRAVNCISTFDTSGGLRHLHDVPSGGATPRHFTISGDDMFVANQDSDVVTPFRFDPLTGLAQRRAGEVSVRKAAFVRAEYRP
jgi:6-phosphogluconolactonase